MFARLQKVTLVQGNICIETFSTLQYIIYISMAASSADGAVCPLHISEIHSSQQWPAAYRSGAQDIRVIQCLPQT